MKELIEKWVKQKEFNAILAHKTLKSMFYYEVYDLIGQDGCFYSLNVLYSETRLLGTLNILETVKLTGEVADEASSDLDSMLESMLVRYDSFEDWKLNRKAILKGEDFRKLVLLYINSITTSLYGLQTSSGHVVKVEPISTTLPILLVRFVLDGEPQIPVVLNIGEPSLIKRRDFYYDSFVERLCEMTGGVIWY